MNNFYKEVQYRSQCGKHALNSVLHFTTKGEWNALITDRDTCQMMARLPLDNYHRVLQDFFPEAECHYGETVEKALASKDIKLHLLDWVILLANGHYIAFVQAAGPKNLELAKEAKKKAKEIIAANPGKRKELTDQKNNFVQTCLRELQAVAEKQDRTKANPWWVNLDSMSPSKYPQNPDTKELLGVHSDDFYDIQTSVTRLPGHHAALTSTTCTKQTNGVYVFYDPSYSFPIPSGNFALKASLVTVDRNPYRKIAETDKRSVSPNHRAEVSAAERVEAAAENSKTAAGTRSLFVAQALGLPSSANAGGKKNDSQNMQTIFDGAEKNGKSSNSNKTKAASTVVGGVLLSAELRSTSASGSEASSSLGESKSSTNKGTPSTTTTPSPSTETNKATGTTAANGKGAAGRSSSAVSANKIATPTRPPSVSPIAHQVVPTLSEEDVRKNKTTGSTTSQAGNMKTIIAEDENKENVRNLASLAAINPDAEQKKHKLVMASFGTSAAKSEQEKYKNLMGRQWKASVPFR
ncbi:unnamed protein product [Amoebophrya sp. A120]|nr:unnamed protein product [Amoebophrya sp. A120]|eukprot:GSA120T00010965001.1